MHKYLITSKDIYTDRLDEFCINLHTSLSQHMPSYALYRDKSNKNYDIFAEKFVEICASFKNVKSFIHQDVDLAKELHAKGVHLTSLQFNEIKRAKALDLEVIISTHTLDEVLKAEELGADAVTYSSIFESPGKGEPKGVDNLTDVVSKVKVKVFALGGIVDDSHIDKIRECNVYGFASIRYFSP